MLAPVFRIDAVTEENKGSHIYAYATGEPLLSRGGFFGNDTMEIRHSCDSFNSSQGSYSEENRLTNCPVSSARTVKIHRSAVIYGSAQSGGAIISSPPYGGDVCANFDEDCPEKGKTCEGAGCSIPVMEKYESFDTYCRPSEPDQGDVNVTGAVTLVSNGNETWQRCWKKITVAKDGMLTLTSTDHPYFFDSLQVSPEGTLKIQPFPSDGYVSVFVSALHGNKLSGGIINTGKPCQFHLLYLGTQELSLESSTDPMMRITAPSAAVELKSKLEFFGAIRAKQLTVHNIKGIHYDESCNDRMVRGIKFRVRKQGEVYR